MTWPALHTPDDLAVEQGRYSPPLEVAFRIARVFGLGNDDVFSYASED